MAVCYTKLWHILLDKGMMKKDLEALAGVSHYTITQLGKTKLFQQKHLSKSARH